MWSVITKSGFAFSFWNVFVSATVRVCIGKCSAQHSSLCAWSLSVEFIFGRKEKENKVQKKRKEQNSRKCCCCRIWTFIIIVFHRCNRSVGVQNHHHHHRRHHYCYVTETTLHTFPYIHRLDYMHKYTHSTLDTHRNGSRNLQNYEQRKGLEERNGDFETTSSLFCAKKSTKQADLWSPSSSKWSTLTIMRRKNACMVAVSANFLMK